MRHGSSTRRVMPLCDTHSLPCHARRRPRLRSLALVWVMLLGAGCADRSPALVVSGRVEVDDVHIGSKIGGRVAEVAFEEGDSVAAGDVIVLLEQDELLAQRAEVQAAAAQARAQLDLLLAGTRAEDLDRAEAMVAARRAELDLREKGFRAEEVREAEAHLASAQDSLALARKEFERAQSLYDKGVIQQEDVDVKRTAVLTAEAAAESARQRVALLRSGSRPEEIAMARAQLAQAAAELERLRNGPRPEEIAAQRAAVDAAEARIAHLETQLEETRLRTPVDALVETLDLEPGDLVKPGQPVAVLNLHANPWVRCYVPENRLGWVKPGTAVTVTVDTYPDRRIRATVRRVSSEAEFTPRNVQTTEKRVELVFEVKVDVTESPDLLRAGMYADVRIPAPTGP